MPYDGATWSTATPTNATLANELDDVARDIKMGVTGRMAREHLWGASQAATSEAGCHLYVSFSGQTATPGLVMGTQTQQGLIFVNDTSKSLQYVASNSGIITVVAGATDTGGLIPTGVMVPYGANKSPAGWIVCTGGAVSRTTYVRLYGVIGTVWGTGDGSTTFNVPDMRGYIPVGLSAAGLFATLAGSTGAVTHTLSIAEMPAHTHTATVVEGGGNGANFRGNEAAAASGTPNTASTGGGGAHNNVQPSKVVYYIIKD